MNNNFEEIEGILSIELLNINNQSDDIVIPDNSPPEYMFSTEDFEIAMVAEMNNTEDLRNSEDIPMEQETPELAECLAYIKNFNEPIDVEELNVEKKVSFEEHQISATSSKLSESQETQIQRSFTFDPSPAIVRRSSRIHKSTPYKSILKNSPMTTRIETSIIPDKTPKKRNTVSPKSNRKRKSNPSQERPTKYARTQSASRAPKSPKLAPKKKAVNRQKLTENRMSTGSSGRRHSARFNKN